MTYEHVLFILMQTLLCCSINSQLPFLLSIEVVSVSIIITLATYDYPHKANCIIPGMGKPSVSHSLEVKRGRRMTKKVSKGSILPSLSSHCYNGILVLLTFYHLPSLLYWP